MPKDPFQYRLKKNATTYYYLENGVVYETTDTTDNRINLLESYGDWATTKGTYNRSTESPGVFRKALPDTVQFLNDGAQILRWLYNTQGNVTAICYFEIMTLFNGLTYKLWDVFQVDFSVKYESSEIDVHVALIEGGLNSLYKAYKETTFPLKLTDALTGDGDTVNVLVDGVTLLGTYNYQMLNMEDLHCNVAFAPSGETDPVKTMYTIPLAFVDEEGAYSLLHPEPVSMGRVVPGSTFNEAWCAKALVSFRGTLQLNIDFERIRNGSFSSQQLKLQIRIRVYKNESWSDDSKVADVVVWEDPAGYIEYAGDHLSPTSSAITTPWTHNFREGDYLMVGFSVLPDTALTSESGSYLDVALKYVNNTDDEAPGYNPAYVPPATTIKYEYLQDATPTRAITQRALFEKLVKTMTNGAYGVKSDLLNTDVYPDNSVWGLNPYNTFYTCGDALRQLFTSADGGYSDPILKTSLKDFEKDAFVSQCAGIGIEKDDSGNTVLALEHLSHFYQKDVLIADLGDEISNFRVSSYMDYKYNGIKAGYKDQTYDGLNGRFESNVQTEWKTSLTTDDASLAANQKIADWVSPYRADPWGIEGTRANLSNKKTTDASSDNDVFKLQGSGNTMYVPGTSPPPYLLERAHAITAGLPSPITETVYNMPLTPKRQMLRMLPLLKSTYYGTVEPKLTFLTSTKNKDVAASLYIGSVVTESEDIDLTPDGDILYIPVVFSFTAVADINLMYIMDNNPYGVFRFVVKRGNTRHQLEGFILKAGCNPMFSDTFDFELLCSPNTPIPPFL